jgi:hypothetical protein
MWLSGSVTVTAVPTGSAALVGIVSPSLGHARYQKHAPAQASQRCAASSSTVTRPSSDWRTTPVVLQP